MPDIAIALSGGVDSSVSAALLAEAGRDVFGVTMRLGLAEIAGRPCCGEEEVLLARRVCAQLGIPHMVVDVSRLFSDRIVANYATGYAEGRTPNPCVRCNEVIKFGELLERVQAAGASKLATGHYARLVSTPTGVRLRRAADRTKDQSYFLYRVPPMVLASIEFPLGDLPKARVRELALEHGLPTAHRRDSQEVCFVDPGHDLVARLHPDAARPGPIVDPAGAVLGVHEGIYRYTVGQRKRLGIGGAGGPWYVVAVDAVSNTLTVGTRADLERDSMTLGDPVWLVPESTLSVLVQVRYGATPVAATATNLGDTVTLTFEEPVAATAPGQSVVIYDGDLVVGGGILIKDP